MICTQKVTSFFQILLRGPAPYYSDISVDDIHIMSVPCLSHIWDPILLLHFHVDTYPSNNWFFLSNIKIWILNFLFLDLILLSEAAQLDVEMVSNLVNNFRNIQHEDDWKKINDKKSLIDLARRKWPYWNTFIFIIYHIKIVQTFLLQMKANNPTTQRRMN